jgi:glycosyltransferase involved in cell wall biosynthesis
VDLLAVTTAAAAPLEPADMGRWEPPVIVAAGRLAEAKNYPLLIDALAILRRTVRARLFILGQGDRETAMREQIDRLGLTDAVVLCGFQANPWAFIARADVFALTSRYEGFGNVLVEAMACGVPVIATTSPGTREIVTDGVDGLLVDRHEPDAVAAALARVLTDAVLRQRLAAGARISASRFALPAIAAAYDTLLHEVLSC